MLMRKRAMKGWLLAVIAAASASAQNPLETLPNNYKLVMENQWVRVIRVHYAPHENVPVHDHAAGPVIYVYLADGGPVRFQHFTPRQVLAIRPPIKQGGFRMHHALVERHSVENTSDLPSDFLRVELKALPTASQIPDGKFDPPILSSGQNLEKVEFEDDNVRIVRSVCWPHQVCNASDVQSAGIDIAFTQATLVQKDPKVECIKLQAGQVRWMTPIGKEEEWNPGASISHRLRIEFKVAQ
ncbi:MAG: hypothetical protein ACRD3Q_07970 [Terriglobales bacterium]